MIARESGWPGLATQQCLGVMYDLGKLNFRLSRAVLGVGRQGRAALG